MYSYDEHADDLSLPNILTQSKMCIRDSDKCNTAERVPPWHNIDLPTKSNGLCGKQADAR